jgi:hypothetical protein
MPSDKMGPHSTMFDGATTSVSLWWHRRTASLVCQKHFSSFRLQDAGCVDLILSLTLNCVDNKLPASMNQYPTEPRMKVQSKINTYITLLHNLRTNCSTNWVKWLTGGKKLTFYVLHFENRCYIFGSLKAFIIIFQDNLWMCDMCWILL